MAKAPAAGNPAGPTIARIMAVAAFVRGRQRTGGGRALPIVNRIAVVTRSRRTAAAERAMGPGSSDARRRRVVTSRDVDALR